MRQEHIIRIIRFLVFALVLLTPLFYFKWSVYPQILPKTLFFQALAGCIVIFWIGLAIFEPWYRPRRTPLSIALAIFFILLTFTGFLGVDPLRSFWSSQERAFGIIALLHLGGLYLALSSLREALNWRHIFYVSVAASAVVAVIAFIQTQNSDFLLAGDLASGRQGSTFGNPGFMAGYLLFNIFLAAWLFFTEQQRWRKTTLGIASFLIIGALGLSGARGAFLGLIAGVAVLGIFFVLRPLGKSRLVFGSLFGLLIVFVLFFWGTRTASWWTQIPLLGRLQNFSFASAEFVPRRIALRAAWEGFQERPLKGWGWENFNVVFNKHYDPRALAYGYQETRFDKPHNIFAEYLVAGGVPLFLGFLGVLGALLLALWKGYRRGLAGTLHPAPFLAGAFAGYLVYGATAFETLGTGLMFFLLAAFIDSRGHVKGGQEVLPPETPASSRRTIYGGSILAAILAVYGMNALPLFAARAQYEGFMRMSKNPAEGIAHFKKALEYREPYQWQIKRDFAIVLAETYFYNPGALSRDAGADSFRLMQEVVEEHPQDAYNHYVLVDIYNQISDIEPATFLGAAELEAKKALELSPHRQEVYFSLAKTKTLEGKNEEALQILKKALALDPAVPDAHFYYGLIAFTVGDGRTGYLEIKKAMELGRAWRKYHEPRVVANFFADSGHLEEAIGLYKEALRMEPGDLEARTKLGIAYFIKGDRILAREQLLEIGRRFDFKKSPSYAQIKPILDELGIPLGN